MSKLECAIEEWLETKKRNTVKPATYDRLETSLKSLTAYDLGKKEVSDLTPDDLDDYINELVIDGYALTTIKKQFHLVTGYLRHALSKGIINRPIYEDVKLPAQAVVKKKKQEIQCYTMPEQVALKRVLRFRKRTGYAAALLMLETGLRVGECLALTWSDVQWERRAISVNKTLIRLANRKLMMVQHEPKSFTSKRTIPLSTDAYLLMKELYDETDDPYGYIFQGSDGRPLSYEALRYQIKHACLDAKVPYKGQHVFRHTFATNCYNRGANVKILSKILGHSNTSVTYNIYIHLFGDALEEMRSVVG